MLLQIFPMSWLEHIHNDCFKVAGLPFFCMNETQAHQPSAMSCIQFMRGFCPFLNDFPSLYNVIRFICCLDPEYPLLLQDHLDQVCYHSYWMLMASFAIPVCVFPQIHTVFLSATSFPPLILSHVLYQHIQPQFYSIVSNIIICDWW